jgi:ribonuclease HII
MQIELFDTILPGMLQFELESQARGFKLVAGIDEAGRGPLAGPVVAAAVILSPDQDIGRINDSKKLSETTRELLFEQIRQQSLAVGIGIIGPEVIDRINILQATRLAMLNAVTQLSTAPDCLLIDGISKIDSQLHQLAIKQGDGRSASIAAASIIAKVTRDRLMTDFDRLYPQYGFAGHKGYGSAKHLAAIRLHGPCPIHRKTFGGVKEHL